MRVHIFRPPAHVEPLENRLYRSTGTITPSAHEDRGMMNFTGGVLQITPAGGAAAPQPVNIVSQVVTSITLPSGQVIPGHGLKTAEAQTPVVDWTPT